jgi:probable HAF family extracellular repeat protein
MKVNRMNRFLVGMACVAGVGAAQAATYRVVDLGIAEGFVSSFAYGLSDNNLVAGWVQDAAGGTQAFRWSAAEGLTVLALRDGATASRGFGVNSAGQVVGETAHAGEREATLWADGSAQGLGTLNGAGSSVAFAINDAGQVTGWSDAQPDTRAFLWSAGGGMQNLGVVDGGSQSRAYAINNDGIVAGWGRTAAGDRGFTGDAGGLQGVGTAGADAASRTRAFGISSNGWVTGDASDPAFGSEAFLWSSGTGVMALGKLAGSTASFGAGVNADGVAVGWTESAAGDVAFLWSSGGGMQSLDGLLQDSGGWQIQRARSINDAGYIVGNALSADGQLRAVMLVPVPEPASWAMLGAGALLVFGAATRWRD